MSLRKWGSVIMVAAALIMALAGCSLSIGSQRKAEQKVRNKAEAATIQAALARVPDVMRVQVAYSNYITNPGSAHVNIAVERDADLEHVADIAVEKIWRSKLNPLDSIRVGVVNDSLDGAPGIVRGYNIFDDGPELEAKYGPRPVGLR